MPGFGTYLRAAFNARPLGMPVPPNWLFLAATALVAWFVSPGAVFIAAGLEIGYLAALATNQRFRNLIDAELLPRTTTRPDRRAALLGQLDDDSKREQATLEGRCLKILTLHAGDSSLVDQQEEQLAQLTWLHLRLLAARTAVRAVVLTGAAERKDLTRRLRDLEQRRDAASSDLAHSIEGQATIVRTRLAQFDEAQQRTDYLEAELDRLRQQAELIYDQSLLAAGGTDGSGLSSSIASLGDSLANTNRWLRDQRLTADSAWEEAPPLRRPVAQ